ncbi:hypothetical protein L1887_25315 [Cichorium endivia]|nr:hypothetical protein L1887_25315 [Cichorium endivia]
MMMVHLCCMWLCTDVFLTRSRIPFSVVWLWTILFPLFLEVALQTTREDKSHPLEILSLLLLKDGLIKQYHLMLNGYLMLKDPNISIIQRM